MKKAKGQGINVLSTMGGKRYIFVLDFRKTYGIFGVTIDKEHKIDYEKNLIPPSSKYHIILHKKKNRKSLGEDVLKNLIDSKG